MNIASLVMGIVSLILSWIPIWGFVLAIVALVIAIIAMVVKKAEEKGKGMKIAGIILSIIAVVVSLIVTVGSVLLMKAAVDIVDTGKGLVDSALEGTGIDRVENNMDAIKENTESAITNNAQSNNKTAITADKFAEIMQAKGYEVGDFTSQFAQYGDYAKKVCAARTTGYQIEFFELANEANAIESYNTNKTKFESQKGGTSLYYTISMNNYNIYTLTTNGKYKYICRVDNTFIYADVAEEYKDAVKNIIEELGY